MNNARGYLTEFLVTKAVSSTGLRIERDPYEVLKPDGTTIEVTTSVYLHRGTSTNSRRSNSRGSASTYEPQKSGWHRFPCYSRSSRSRQARIHKDYSTLLTRQQHFHILPQADGKETRSGIRMLSTPKKNSDPSVAYEKSPTS